MALRELVAKMVDLVLDVTVERMTMRLEKEIGSGQDVEEDDDIDLLDDEEEDEEEDLGSEQNQISATSPLSPSPSERIGWKPFRFVTMDGDERLVESLDIPSFGKQGEPRALKIVGGAWNVARCVRVRGVVRFDPRLAQAIVNMIDRKIEGAEQPRFVLHQIHPAVQIGDLRTPQGTNLLPPGWSVLEDGAEIGLLLQVVMSGSHDDLTMQISVPGFVPDEILASVPSEHRKVMVSLSLGLEILDDASFGSTHFSGRGELPYGK